jgi:serine/threonine protein kinase
MPYMSPEELAGNQADQRSDIFSLGVMLYEMTTGRRPFQAGTTVVIASSILRDNPAPLGTLRPGIPSGLGELVAGCLEKNPGDRPLTVRADS